MLGHFAFAVNRAMIRRGKGHAAAHAHPLMAPLARRALVIVSAGVLGVLAVVAVGVAWSDRAEDVCRDEAPRSAGGYSVTWEWSEFAYVCNYRAPNAQPKRVGIIDAFHGEGRRPHGPER